ncbi:MAG TPA: CDP-diacylglycerol--serine O-phosphatidyltransferase [Polyangiales bacterium]|nr:CDP-diacylglycerol--serine O-phosphatidyltransferase [Polyangiales bacterium]
MRINLRKTLFILPNLFTLSSIFCGFYAILLSGGNPTPDEMYRASMLIIFAMFFDMVDGRVARLTRTQSAFGVEIDSLADVVSFGVAPGVLVYNWSLSALGGLGVAAAFAYVACGAIRLARFNVLATDTTGRPKKPSKYILGLPIPGAAGILVSLVAANHAVDGQLAVRHALVAAVMFSLSFFMVSTIKFRSFKDLRFSWRTALLVMFAVSTGVVMSVKLHVTFALCWMLTSYVLIGLLETLLGLARRLGRKASREPSEETLNSGV